MRHVEFVWVMWMWVSVGTGQGSSENDPDSSFSSKRRCEIIKQAVAELFFLALSPDSTQGCPFLPLDIEYPSCLPISFFSLLQSKASSGKPVNSQLSWQKTERYFTFLMFLQVSLTLLPLSGNICVLSSWTCMDLFGCLKQQSIVEVIPCESWH